MEFREYYSGICAKIRLDYPTSTYIGELVGVPSPVSIEATSYEEIRGYLKQAVRDHLSALSESIEDEWNRVVRLDRIRAEKEARQKAELEAAETHKTSKSEKAAHRQNISR